jgi:hypothetical protein
LQGGVNINFAAGVEFASGHATAAPPTSVMNSRRFMLSMGDFLPYAY